MKNFAFRLLFVGLGIMPLTLNVFAQPGCPSINAGVDQSVTCSSNCATLTSTYLATGATNSYTVSSIPYAPPYSYSAGSPLLVNIDDTWSGVLNIPFTFCFFGTAYTQLVAGSNGCVTFSTAPANTSCAWSFSSTCPNANIISGSTGPYILAPYHDIDPSVTGDMYYNTYGSYPCRTFVISWNQVAMFSCTSMKATHMVVMYESTNVIEVYIQNKPTCTTWNSGNAVIGIQNAAGTVGYVPPGRNTGQWTTSNEAWRFTPNGTANYVTSWWQGGTQIASGATTTVCPTTTTTYTAQIVYTNCNAAQVTVTDPMTVTVTSGLSASVSPATTSICQGNSTTLTASGGTTYAWSDGSTGASISVSPASTTTYTVTATTGSCTNTAQATVTVNSAPPADAGLPQSICSGNSATLTATGGGTYAWSTGGSTASISVSPASTTTYTVTVTNSGCTATDNVTVTVNPVPTADAGLPQTICPTNTATLTASGGGTYSWSTGDATQSVSVSPLSTTTYTVTVTSLGCTATDNVTVTVNSTITADAGLPQTICSGQSATLTASGGSTYSWSNGGATASISVSPVTTTTYTVTVSSGGCTGTDNVSVTVNALPTADAGSLQSVCTGQSTLLTATGGGTYNWNTGDASSSITVSPGSTTTYTVTVTNSGCSASDDVVVTVNSIPVADAGMPQTICPGGSATLIASGGSSYSWSTGSSTASTSVSPASTTTYTVTVSNLGCTSSDDVTVTVNSGITADAGLPQTICSGQSATLTASGGSTYSWSNGDLTQVSTVSPASTTTYSVTVSSGGCSGTDDVTVTVNPAPAANAGTDQIICTGQSANLTAFGGGTYLWSNSSTNQSINVTPTVTTLYLLTVTSAAGCTATDDIQVTVNPLPNASAGPDQSICFGNSATLIASGGVSYSWSPTTDLSNPLSATTLASPTTTISYTVLVTDANGCTNTDGMNLNVSATLPANAGLDQTICSGQTASLSASGGVFYAWSPGSGLSSTSISNPGASPTSTTTYTVTVSDANGCSASDDLTITVNPIPSSTFTLTSPICVGQTSNIVYNGDGTPAAIYNWDFDGGTVISGNGQGPYEVSWNSPSTYNVSLDVTENGCTSNTTTNTQIVGQVTATIAITDSVSCFGYSDGTATVTATGASPYQYLWSDMQMGQTAFNLSANTLYTVAVSDNNGCTASQSITFSEPPLLSMNFTTTDVSCFGGNNGFASAMISGGTTPYQYSWTPVGTAGNVSSVNTLQAGPYSLMVYDAHGCNVDTNFAISQPSLLTYSFVTDSVNCNMGTDGSISIMPSGGDLPYAYTWSPSISTGPSATNIAAGTYSVTITDHNGCDTTAVITVDQPLPLVLSTSGDITICNGQSTTINAYATGGTGSYTFSWDNGLGIGNTFSVSPTVTTSYSVSVTDENGCTIAPEILTVYVSPPISVILSSSPSAFCQGGSTLLSATANGGNGNYIYTWSNGIGISNSSITVSPSATTTYSVTVTDNCNSPQAIDSVTITIYPLPQVQFVPDIIQGCEPLAVNFTDLSTPAISSWLWNFGDIQSGSNNNSVMQNPTHLFANSGWYNVTLDVTTTDGCTGSITYSNLIEVYPTPDAYFYYDPQSVSILSPYVNFIDGSTDASSWDWNFGDPASLSNNSSTDPSPGHYFANPGTYNVSLIIVSQYGCIDSTSTDIVVNPEFTFYAPNAFTPDGNGKNDFFYTIGEGWDLNNFEFYIFDRWGEMIFKTNNNLEYWDGKVIGGNRIAPQGVYTWIVILKDIAGDTHTFNGRVTLLRK